jgi:predicted PurR-regulated permease PerM
MLQFAPEAMVDITSDGAGEVKHPQYRGDGSRRFVSFWRAGIFGLAAMYTLSWAKPVLLPIVLALLLSFVFAPIVRGMRRFGVHEVAGAGLVVATLLGVLALAVYQFSGPAADILADAPRNLAQIGNLWRRLWEPVDRMSQAAEEAGNLTNGAPDDEAVEVTIREPAWSDILVDTAFEIAVAAVIVFALLFFLLAGRNRFLRKLVRITPGYRRKRALAQIARGIENQASAYLLAFAFNNFILGCAVAVALSLLGMPYPALWGTVAAVFNFIPYMGALITLSALTLASVSTFEDVASALYVPAAFLVLTTLEGTLMQPILIGRRLALNPVGIFVSILLWGWLWGIPGALLAVPMLAVAKTVCDAVETLRPFGQLLGE